LFLIFRFKYAAAKVPLLGGIQRGVVFMGYELRIFFHSKVKLEISSSTKLKLQILGSLIGIVLGIY